METSAKLGQDPPCFIRHLCAGSWSFCTIHYKVFQGNTFMKPAYLTALISAVLSSMPQMAVAEVVTPGGNEAGQVFERSDPLRLEQAQRLLAGLHFQELLKLQMRLNFTGYLKSAQGEFPGEKAKKMEDAFREIIALTDSAIDYPAYERDMAVIFADLFTHEELVALTSYSATPLGRKFFATHEPLLQRWSAEENRRIVQLSGKIGDIYQRIFNPMSEAVPPASTTMALPPQPPLSPSLPGRAKAEDFTADLATLRSQSQAILRDSYAEVRQSLQVLQDMAHAQGNLGVELGCVRRLLSLPQAAENTAPPAVPVHREPVPLDNVEPAQATTPRLSFTGVDQLAVDRRLAADQRLGELYRPIRHELQSALASALQQSRSAEARALWSILCHVPQEWSSELLKEPLFPQPDFDRTNALPITSLPAHLELTVEPGGHDVHVGICGFDDEDITEIYLGGWWGRVSGIRARPGGEEAARKDHFKLFDAQRALPDEQTLLQDDTQGTPFNSILPTTFRIAVSTYGIVVSRVDHGQEIVIMETDHLFNRPTSFTFKSSTYRLLSVRASPGTAWSDETKRIWINPQEKTNF